MDHHRFLAEIFNHIFSHIGRYAHDVEVVHIVAPLRMCLAAHTHVVAIDKSKHMESFTLCILRALFFKVQTSQTEVQLLVLTENQLFPAVAGFCDTWLLYDVVRAIGIVNYGRAAVLCYIFFSETGVDRPLFAVEVQAEIVIHLVRVGTDGERAYFENHLVASAGVDCSGRKHYLKARFGLLIADIFHIVAWCMLRVGSLYFAEELRNVRVVTEADECLGIVSGYAHIITLVLSAEFSVMFTVVG